MFYFGLLWDVPTWNQNITLHSLQNQGFLQPALDFSEQRTDLAPYQQLNRPIVKRQEEEQPPQGNILEKQKEVAGQNKKDLKVHEESLSLYQEEMMKVKSRNILPNVINLVVSFIRRVNKSGRMVGRIISYLGESEEKVKKYYSYQLYLKETITNFNSKNIIHLIITFCDPTSSIFSIQEQLFYNRVTRILIAAFLKTEGSLGLLTSRKQHRTKKKDHFKVYRYLLQDLRRYYLREKSAEE